MKAMILSFLIVFMATDISIAGPFGTNMGDNEQKFSGLNLVNIFPNNIKEYSTKTVPNPHKIFEIYMLTFVNGGLARIEGFKEFTPEDGENSFSDCFNSIFIRLKDKYGAPNEKTNGVANWNKKLSDNLSNIRLLIVPNEKNRLLW